MPLDTFSRDVSEWTGLNLINCIGVDECMRACPVVPPGLSIADLNDAARDGAELTGGALKLARDCVQCGRCDTVCPALAGRSVMMLALKEKMANAGFSPAYHKKYFALKGYDKSAARRAAFGALMKAKWKISGADRLKSEKLAPHIGKPRLRKAEYLIYLGCYVFTKTDSAAQTVDIAERLGIDHEVLGGLETCCGWPSLLAGRTDEAERYHERLAATIREAEPEYAVTGCAECYMALVKIKHKYAMAFEPLTTPMWLNRFADRLGLRKSDAQVTFHDSCHISRKAGAPEPARELLRRMAPVVEMERSGPGKTFCCGYWGLKSDEAQQKAIHASRLDEAMGTGAAVMAVECVTCLESFSENGAAPGVDVRDIVGMVHERMRP
ncbi:MAG: heterodisulfide reductase-related iron-sulfur binding cluster [Candidatus Nitrospinota bacterium M3_3B_026]